MTEHGFDMGAVAVGASCIAIWSLSARRLASWNVSSAMTMVGLGLIVANEPLNLVDVMPTSETLRLIVELTLVLVLFSDASRVNLRGLRTDTAIPARLLFIGLPLTIALGFGVAAFLFDLDPWLCALDSRGVGTDRRRPRRARRGQPSRADAHQANPQRGERSQRRPGHADRHVLHGSGCRRSRQPARRLSGFGAR